MSRCRAGSNGIGGFGCDRASSYIWSSKLFSRVEIAVSEANEYLRDRFSQDLYPTHRPQIYCLFHRNITRIVLAVKIVPTPPLAREFPCWAGCCDESRLDKTEADGAHGSYLLVVKIVNKVNIHGWCGRGLRSQG